MSLETLLQLAVLALIDSTSIGTLVIPLWLLLRRGNRALAGKVLLYLGVVAAFYLALGVLLISGGRVIVEHYGDAVGAALEAPGLRWVALAAGVGLIVYGFSGPWSKTEREKAAAEKAARRGPEGGWGARIDRALRTPWALVGLGIVAGLLEVPTMLPYLAASGLIVASGAAFPVQLGVLALYCLVMVVPALVLLGARVLLGDRADAWFGRVAEKLGGYVSESAKWIAAIGGILIVRWASSGPDGVGLGQLFPALFGGG
ncbi:GAP family protein [Galactobacter valiniphilus]|uniref:GAP family protein n=1 Tax=Galactobacter valiniphilus TaxID=2676122 RepID=UPI003735B106